MRLSALGLAVAWAALVAGGSAFGQPAQRRAVVELFTSQGCSSCPPADAVFEQYAKRDDVIALSFSVHYWDNLGWKDTLASPQFTYRQKAYSKARGDGQVYTPQVVVNGAAHVVGSDQSAVEDAVKASRSGAAATWVPLKLTRTGAEVVVEAAGQDGTPADTTIWLATVTRKIDVAVKRGENAGRNLTYFNVVRSFDKIGTYAGKAVTFRIDAKVVDQAEIDGLVALMQAPHGGPIIGATTLAMK